MSEYDPKTITQTQLSTNSDQCFAFLKEGKCKWGATCRFKHGQSRSTTASWGKKNGKGVTVQQQQQHGIVVTEKAKKPKHLKRKLQQARESGNEQRLKELEDEEQSLWNVKHMAAKQFKKTCKNIVTKLYGEEKFDESKFKEYLDAGYSKKKLLKRLGISEEDQGKFKEAVKAEKKAENNTNLKHDKDNVNDRYSDKNYKKKFKLPENDYNDDNYEDNSTNTNVKTKLKVDKKSCKKLVKKLYGDERWNEEQFDELIGQGMKGEELLTALGISKKNLHNFK